MIYQLALPKGIKLLGYLWSEATLAIYRRVRYKVALPVKRRFFKCAAFAVCIAIPAPVTFGFGDNPITRAIETQTTFIRHTATAIQRRVAEQNAKAFLNQLPPS